MKSKFLSVKLPRLTMNKNILVVCAIIAPGAFQMPASAENAGVTSWGQLVEKVGAANVTIIGLDTPNPVGDNPAYIYAPSGSAAIINNKSTEGGLTIEFYTGCNGLVGGGGLNNEGIPNYVFINAAGTLNITGTGTIDSNSNGVTAAIQNQGYLTINSITLNGGLIQGADGNSTTIYGMAATNNSAAGSTAVFSGANNIVGGSLNFTGPASTLVFDGGVLGPAAVFDLSAGNTLQLQAGTVTLNGSGAGTIDTWAGAVQVFNYTGGSNEIGTGTLVLDNLTHNTADGAYLQQGENSSTVLQNGSSLTLATGTSNLRYGNMSISDSTLTVANGLTTDSDGISLNNAVVAIGPLDSAATLTIANGSSSAPTSFTLLAGTSIQGGNINIDAGNTLNIAGGNVAFNTNESSGWVGTVNANGGNLTLNAFNALDATPTNGKYTQSSGVLTLSGGSILDLAAGSNITGGSVTFATGDFSGNVLNVSGGTIDAAAVVYLAAQNTINISGNPVGGSVTLDSGDTWLGEIANSTEGTLTLSGLTHNTANGIYTQTDADDGATLVLENGAKLTLSTGSAIGTGTLTFSGSGNTLEVAGGTLGVYLGLTSSNTLLVSNGAATLSHNMTNWAGGSVELTGGTITSKGFSHDSAAGSYNQTGGVLDLTQKATTSSLTLTTMNSTITGGTVNIGGIGGPGDTGNSLTISTNGTFDAVTGLDYGAAVTIAEGNTLNVAGGIVNLNGGGPGTDDWSGNVNVSAFAGQDGYLTLSGIHNNPGSTFTQGNGTTFLTNGSTLSVASGSSITGGNVILDSASVAYSGVIVATGGTFASNAAINIATGNYFHVTGGTATLNGTGAGSDNWDGTVTLSAGTLNLDSIVQNGTFNQTGGTSTVSGVVTISTMSAGTATLNGATSAITTLNGGTVNLGTTALTVSGGTTSGAITGAGGSLIKAGSGTLTLTGNLSYTGATTVSAGTLEIDGITAFGANVTVAAGATLGGSGTIGSMTIINGTHSPGNSPGVQTFNNSLIYNDGSRVIWELAANTAAGRGTNYDGINADATVAFNGTVTLNLAFNAAGSAVNWADPFWSTDRQWDVYSLGGTTAGFDNLKLASIDWADSTGALFNTALPGSTFSIAQQGTGIVLTYNGVPEPATCALVIMGASALWFSGRRRRLG